MNRQTQLERIPILPLLIALALVALASPAVAVEAGSSVEEDNRNQVLEWNQIAECEAIANYVDLNSMQRLRAGR